MTKRPCRKERTGTFRRHFLQCTHASECGRLCPCLVKGPGVANVWCVDLETGEKVPLYDVLKKPEGACRLGRF